MYQKKFKDRDPLDTVKIIDKYFTDLGFKIEKVFNTKSEGNTYSCALKLYYQDIPLFSQNGKGVSEEYCLASGYGELYERFCSGLNYMNDPFLFQEVIQNRKQKYGYYIDPKEQLISFNDCFPGVLGKDFLETFSTEGKHLEEYFNLIFKNQYIGIPYSRVLNPKEIKFLDPRIVLYLHGSSGLACGNTFYEAFVQGMSEIYEHHVVSQYWTKKFDNYYAIDLNNITNIKLQEMIQEIKKYNDFYIIDMSYNFNVPVLMSLAVNKTTHAISVNLGASPIFDIACERIITELYQGIKKLNEIKLGGQYPSIDGFDLRLKGTRWIGAEAICTIFPEFIIQNMQSISSHSNLFLNSNNQTNEELYNYMLEINKINNMDIYYYNKSGCNDIYAIELFNINETHYLVNYEATKEQVSIKEREEIFALLTDIYKIGQQYLINQQINIETLQDFINKFNSFSEIGRCAFNYLLNDNWLYRSDATFLVFTDALVLIENILHHKELFIDDCDFIHKFARNELVYQQLNKFSILLRYGSNPNYNLNDLLFMANFLCLDYSPEDIINLNNDEYLIKEIVFADMNNIFSHKYDNYIQALSDYNFLHFNCLN